LLKAQILSKEEQNLLKDEQLLGKIQQQIEMLAEASNDAYNRAETMAKNGKGKLGGMGDSSMGVFQIIAQNSSEDYSWGGSYNTTSKLKTATITVKSRYQLK